MRRYFMVPSVILVLVNPTLKAQDEPLQAGARVRVSAPEAGLDEERGSVISCAEGDLVVLIRDTATAIRGTQVTRLWVGAPRREAGKGVAFGALFGALVGAGAGYAMGSDSCDATLSPQSSGFSVDVCLDRSQAAYVGAFGGVLGGALMGLIAGGVARTDRWQEVELPVTCVGASGRP